MYAENIGAGLVVEAKLRVYEWNSSREMPLHENAQAFGLRIISIDFS
jgi:hypothetical protein